jgi:hypothetical protein
MSCFTMRQPLKVEVPCPRESGAENKITDGFTDDSLERQVELEERKTRIN